MTIILTIASLIILISFFMYKYIHKYKLIFYGISAILAFVALEGETNIITFGYVGFSFMIIVMFIGVLGRSQIKKRLIMVRAELSIIGFIFLIPHGWIFLEYVLEDIGLFNAPLSFYFGVLALIVATPLFITSFITIRKRMDYKSWKKLHKFSYVFVTLVALHLILIQNSRMWLYIVLFAIYILFRTITYIQKLYLIKRAQAQ